MALIDIKVPDIGDFKDVAIIELLVKPGDTIKVEQSLLTVESDKASMEIPGRMQVEVPARELVPATATSLSQVPQQQAKQPPVPAPPQQHPASQATGSPSLR